MLWSGGHEGAVAFVDGSWGEEPGGRFPLLVMDRSLLEEDGALHRLRETRERFDAEAGLRGVWPAENFAGERVASDMERPLGVLGDGRSAWGISYGGGAAIVSGLRRPGGVVGAPGERIVFAVVAGRSLGDYLFHVVMALGAKFEI